MNSLKEVVPIMVSLPASSLYMCLV